MSTEPVAQAAALLARMVQRVELAGAYQRAARARQLGVHHADAAALEQLISCGPLTPGDLGRRLGLTSGGVTALTTRLEAQGCVNRDLHPEDGRMRVLSATEHGLRTHGEQMAPVLEASEVALAGLSEQEAELVAVALRLVFEAKYAAAEATPEPVREPVDDGYTRALLM